MTFPSITLVHRRTDAQRGFLPNQPPPKCPLPLWWAEAVCNGVYGFGQGETEDEARYRALDCCLHHPSMTFASRVP